MTTMEKGSGPKEISGAKAIAPLFEKDGNETEQNLRVQTIEEIGAREERLRKCCRGGGNCCCSED